LLEEATVTDLSVVNIKLPLLLVAPNGVPFGIVKEVAFVVTTVTSILATDDLTDLGR
jgi:hypothetical protein